MENHPDPSLGLNQKDWLIYQNLLQHGASAASTLSSRSGIDRTTVYAVLKRLMRKGCVSKSARGGTAVFIALTPDVFIAKMEREIEEKQLTLEKMRDKIALLKQMPINRDGGPQIEVFEGSDATIYLYDFMLKHNRHQKAFLTIDQLPKPLKKYLQKKYISDKIKMKVKSEVIVQESAQAKAYQALDAGANRETKIIPHGKTAFETEIIIGERDMVALFDFQKHPIGLLIQSRGIRNTIAALFERIWSES